MHEVSLVQSLLSRVENEARARHATAVHRVTVRIGSMGGVEPELFATAFDACRTGTICETAELEVVLEDTNWSCPHCGSAIATGEKLVCLDCGWPARLDRGDALILERVEMEVPDHV